MTAIANQRMANTRLTSPNFQTAAEVVQWFGAVQGQEYALAKWALAQRIQQAGQTSVTDADIEAAFNRGDFLRTHVMRPTWHFVTPQDIRWLLELTAPRVHAVNAYMYRQLELDEPLLKRSSEIIAQALQGGHHLTRKEVGAVLDRVGIKASSMRLGYITHYAELERIVCSGPRRGKQQTYALIDERAPQAKSLPRDEALAELTRRFFTSHGPATVHDFAWWSGLTIADVRAGIALLGDVLTAEDINGKTYWSSASALPPLTFDDQHPDAYLLPPYDEYTIHLRDYYGIVEPGNLEPDPNSILGGILVISGKMVGNWRRIFVRKTVQVELAPLRPLTDAEQDAVTAAADRLGDFLEMPASVVYVTPDNLVIWRKSQTQTQSTT